MKQIIHSEEACFPYGELCRKHGAQRQTGTTFCAVANADEVRFRVVLHLVDARHFAFADGQHGQFFGMFGLARYAARLSVDGLEDIVGQRDSRSARSI